MKRFSGVIKNEGFYNVEKDIDGDFFWTWPYFTLIRQQSFSYLYIKCCYLGIDGKLSVRAGSFGPRPIEKSLQEGWQEFVLELPNSGIEGEPIEVEVSPATTVPKDSRVFGIRIRSIQAICSSEEYRKIARRISNLFENAQEYRLGVAELRSTPPKLRIDMENGCNMMPRCIYCSWDYTKKLENENKVRLPFSQEYFDELEDYYENAVEVVNCCHGEILVSPYFAYVVERLDSDGKHFEFTTNGLLLNEAVRSLLIGKDIFIYISLDAATAEHFARYRNDQFDLITDNIRQLCHEKRRTGNGFPKVFVSFILMRSNITEVEAFLALSHELGVDAVVFKTLDNYDNTNGLTQIRAGFYFNYVVERLRRDELRQAKERIVKANERWELAVYFTFEAEQGEIRPCEELWQGLYIMDRGFLPCCISRRPAIIDLGEAPLTRKEQIDKAVNSLEFQSMRRMFAQGQVPEYCRDLDCPVIKRA